MYMFSVIKQILTSRRVLLIFLKTLKLITVNVADVSGMEGLLILHQTQGSQDSTDSGSLPPTYSRLPPDGHEFPEDYVDPGNTGTEFLSRKSSASSTSSLDRNQLRANTSTRNKKVQSCASRR